MKRVRNQEGSTLVWAITIIMVMMIVVTAMLTISQNYYSRSLQNFKIRQAEITAQVAGDSLAEIIQTKKDNVYLRLVPLTYDGGKNSKVTVNDIKSGDKMGLATAIITRTEEKKLVIKVTSEYAEVKGEISIKMVLQKPDSGGEQWVRANYKDGVED